MKNKLTEIPKEKRVKLSEYIVKIKEKRNLGFNQLSLKAGLNPSVLNRILKTETKIINPYQLKQIASALRIDYKELYEIIGYLDKKEEDKDKKEEANIEVIKGEYIQVPIYDSVSAGIGITPDPEPNDYLSLPIKMGKGCVGITVNGDSMETTINNGSVVLMKKDIEVAHNDIGVFLYGDEALVKRYKCIENRCYLTSDNKDYPDREIREDDDLKICGKVVWILNKG